jgi:hypothetical protein
MAKKVVGFYGDNTSCDGELREENLMTFRHWKNEKERGSGRIVHVHICDTHPVGAGTQMMNMYKYLYFNMSTIPVAGVENFYEEDGPSYKTLQQHNSLHIL